MSLKIWFNLLRRDMSILKSSLKTKIINTSVITTTNLLVFAYLIPGLSENQKYGAFIFYGAIVIFGFFDIMSKVTETIADVTGENALSHSLVIPLPPRAVFLEIIVNWAASTAIIGLVMFPLGKIFLWSEINLLTISYIRLIPAFITSCLLFGSFSLWLVSVIKSLEEVQTLWFRIINPLFMFGAYFFPWQEAYNLNPYFAYPMLINPLLYAMEAMRSAGLGSSGYLPFWICMLAMWAFIFFFTEDATRKLKKWLDCP